jgi:flagellar basal-body rod modification protein FlgD
MSSVANTTSAQNAAGAGSSNTTVANSALNSNYQDFLKLLTTQLQNQDPTAPADTNQITQQIAMLSQVEQQINTNSNLQNLISLYSNNQLNGSVNYIGKRVEAPGNTGQVVNGAGEFVYNLSGAAATTNVTIKDSTGTTVFTGSGTTVAGKNIVYWDGTNSITGAKMSDGTYTISVTATDSNGAPVTATPETTGIVTSLDTVNGVTTLSLGTQSVPISSVTSVSNA